MKVAVLIFLSPFLISLVGSNLSLDKKISPSPATGILNKNQVAGKSATDADFILGTWLSEHKDGKIQVYKLGSKYFGKVSWIRRKNADNSPILDFKNPNEKLKKMPVLGLVILKNFHFSGDNTWEDGTVYDPLSGHTYASKIAKDSDTVIRIRGFIGIPMFGRTTVWTRSN